MAKRGPDGLTDKQRAFRDKVVEGADLSEAYRTVFDTANMNAASIRKRACELAKLPKIADDIAEFVRVTRAAAAEQMSYSLADAIAEADRLIGVAESEGQSGAAVSAATLKAKLAGHLIERKEVRSGPLEETDVSALLAMRHKLEREQADEAAASELIGAAPASAPKATGGNRPTARTVH